MALPPKLSIREVLLEEIQAHEAANNLQRSPILEAAAKRLAGYDHQAILTQWSELFRTGLLAWGLNLHNPDPPFFHLTTPGRQALANLTRDPSNPAGYLRHLTSLASLDPIAMSYLTEGLDCYVAGLFKASAVMVGAAAECIVLRLRDETLAKLTTLGRPAGKTLTDWRIKTVSDALYGFFGGHKTQFDNKLRDSFDGYWPAFTLQIRASRNDAGHPTSIDPVTPDTVHASLLIFPELARLTNDLSRWVANNLV